MSRRDQLIALLAEYRDRAGSRGGGLGQHLQGDAILLADHDRDCGVYTSLRCTCWRRSLVELERAMGALHDAEPVHHGHLVARYVRCERTRRTVWYRHGRFEVPGHERVVYPDLERGKTPPTRAYDCVVEQWRPWVDLLIVAQALGMLEGLYRGEVWLPEEAMAA